MNTVRMKLLHGLSTCLVAALLSSSALAADVKRECVDASTAGQTSRDAGELLDAREKFLVCSRDACPGVVRSSCSRWLAEVEEQLPSIVVRALDASGTDITEGSATVDGVKVSLDGKAIPLDPGKHTIVLDTDDGVHLEKKVLLAAGEKSRLIELRVEAPKAIESTGATNELPPRRESSGIPTGAWVLGGVSVVALGSFGFFALSANKELTDLDDKCSPGCTESASDKGRRDALIADISLGVGVAALAGAVTWAILGSSSDDSPKSARLSVAPSRNGGYATFSGSF